MTDKFKLFYKLNPDIRCDNCKLFNNNPMPDFSVRYKWCELYYAPDDIKMRVPVDDCHSLYYDEAEMLCEKYDR